MTFWVIACGSGDSQDEMLNVLKDRCDGISDRAFPCQSFDVPETLKFGSFDNLVKLVDDLAKYDGQVESTLRRVERQLLELNPSAEMKIISQRTQQTWESYVRKFKWDDAKFPRSRDLADNLKLLMGSVAKLDEEVRNKSSQYSELKSQVTNLLKKGNATLGAVDLIDILTPSMVSETDFVQTEHIITVCVVVPRGKDAEKNFLDSYERMDANVVPMSAKKFKDITDKDYNTLWRVLLFPSALEPFKKACRDQKLLVREFTYSEANFVNLNQQRAKLEAELKKQDAFLRRVCHAAFSDTFVSWMHLKAIRTFVESAMRFGVPPNFSAFLVKPGKNQQKKFRTTLDDIFGASGLFGSKYVQAKEADQEGGEDYYSYVSLNLVPVTDGKLA